MKKALITIVTAGSLFAGMQAVDAGGCYTPPSCYTPPVCRPAPPCPPAPPVCHEPVVYKIKTIQVDCCRHKLVAYDHCGHPYCYWVTIYTYKDIYSDGTCRFWKKTVRF